MRIRAFALVAVGVSLFAACEEGDIAVSGTGGAAAGTGGSAGKSGSSGTAGKGGTTGGSAGSNATGGGSGEGSSGEAGSGGTAGEAGSGGSSASGAAGESGAPGGAGAPGAGGTNGPGNDLCQLGCVATLAADCENGPNDMQECVSDCRDLLDGVCSEEYETLRTCAVGEDVTCGPMGFPIIEACSDEQSEFRSCIN